MWNTRTFLRFGLVASFSQTIILLVISIAKGTTLFSLLGIRGYWPIFDDDLANGIVMTGGFLIFFFTFLGFGGVLWRQRIIWLSQPGRGNPNSARALRSLVRSSFNKWMLDIKVDQNGRIQKND